MTPRSFLGARRVRHSGRRAVLRLAHSMLWAATFVAAYWWLLPRRLA